MLAFLAFGTLGFWFVAAVFCVAIITATLMESAWCFILTALAFGFCVYATELHVIAWIASNWPLVIVGALFYVLIGVIWSLFKWRDHCLEIKDRIIQGFGGRIPLFYNNKHKIASWIIYWPCSILWWLSYDFVQTILRNLKDYYVKITLGVFADLSDEVKEKIFYQEAQKERSKS